jgi:arginyl-tRNA---protein transferase
MNKFLRDGIKDQSHQLTESVTSQNHEPKPSKERSDLQLEDINISSLQGNDLKVNVKKCNASEVHVAEKKKSIASDSNGSDKPSNPKKAKLIRLERKKEKLAAQGLTLSDVQAKKAGNVEKSLEDFLSEEPKTGKHRLEVKLVPSKEGSSESIFSLYKKYQIHIHHDPPEKLSTRSYERFLVNSPLKVKFHSRSLMKFFFFSLTLRQSWCR